MRFFVLLILVIHVYANALFAQDIVVRADIDTAVIQIGEQTKVKVYVELSRNVDFQYVEHGEELVKNIDLYRSSICDTIQSSKKGLKIVCTYFITSFEPGEYSFQIGPYVCNQDSVWTNTIELKVLDVDVNLEDSIKDIKTIQESLYTWRDVVKKYVWIFLIVIFVLIVGGLLYFLIIKRKVLSTIQTQSVQEYADEMAYRKLDELVEKKLIEVGNYKAFYTELTDILREYFELVLAINTFEKTSDELLRDLTFSGKVSMQIIQPLSLLLAESDLVKFAKHISSPQVAHVHIGIAKQCVSQLQVYIDKSPKE